MGIWRWVRNLIGGEDVRPQPAEAVCPKCHAPLRSPSAKQCFVCGADWHAGGGAIPSSDSSPSSLPSSRDSLPVPIPTTPSGSQVPDGSSDRGPGGPPNAGLPDLWPTDSDVAAQNPPGFDYDQFRRAAMRLQSAWRSPWFGQRDRIPPADDPRTKLLDQAMAGQGFISPAELQEIHDVGEAYDRLRPPRSLAEDAARQALADDQAAREARKQAKRAEAAERRRRRQLELEYRRQNDIIFLGRGVSYGLHDRQSDLEKLAAQELPLLSSPAELADALGVTVSRLRWLAFHHVATARTHYVTFEIPKRSGGKRTLAAPHRQLKQCQAWILERVLRKLSAHPAAHGFVSGKSTVTNAAPHVGREAVVNLDLRDFFPTIDFPRVRGLFVQAGFSPAVAVILALLCTESPRQTIQYDDERLYVAIGQRSLPQGACTSPAISNLIARRLDSRLAGLARKYGWSYTRYADDLTFSGDLPPGVSEDDDTPLREQQRDGHGISPAALINRVGHIVRGEGFALNPDKTRVLRRSAAQTVTGVVVNQRAGAPRALVRRLRAILHRAQREGLAAQNRENHPNFALWLQGMIAYVRMINPDQAAPLEDAWERLQGREAN